MHLRPLSSLAPEDLPTAMAREMAQHKQGQQRTRKEKRANATCDALIFIIFKTGRDHELDSRML